MEFCLPVVIIILMGWWGQCPYWRWYFRFLLVFALWKQKTDLNFLDALHLWFYLSNPKKHFCQLTMILLAEVDMLPPCLQISLCQLAMVHQTFFADWPLIGIGRGGAKAATLPRTCTINQVNEECASQHPWKNVIQFQLIIIIPTFFLTLKTKNTTHKSQWRFSSQICFSLLTPLE